MQWLELRIPPPLVWLVFAGAMLGVAHAAPGLAFGLPGSPVIALTLAVAGVTMAFAGVLALRGKRTTVDPFHPGAASTVVASGVYRVTRNPIYLGLLLTLAGWAVYLSNACAALLLPAFVAYMTRFQIEPEERALLARFGAEFAQYTSHVRRWL